MRTSYDKYYQNQNYFGEPYEGLLDFFKDYQPKGNILDLGCGQGRDSIALAKLGYDVTGIDVSKVGIDQLNQIAFKLNLNAKAMTGDVYHYTVSSKIDIVLLDSMLHFYKKDVEKESDLVLRLLNEIKIGGVLCVCMQKGKVRENILKNLYIKSGIEYEVLYDDYIDYPEANFEFLMFIVKKKI